MDHATRDLATQPLGNTRILHPPPPSPDRAAHDDRPMEKTRSTRGRPSRSRKSMLDEESLLADESEDDEEPDFNHDGRHSLRIWSQRIREFSRLVVRPASRGYRRISDFTLHSIPDAELDYWTSRFPSRSSLHRIRTILICSVAGSIVVIVMCIASRLNGLRDISMSTADGEFSCDGQRDNTSSPPTLDVASPLYHLFDRTTLQKAKANPATTTGVQLRTPRHLSATNGCLEQWFASGVLCDSDIGSQDHLDLVYLWVNGSDPIWQEQYDLTREEEFPGNGQSSKGSESQPPVRHYRSQGSFKYALRSGVEAFRKDGDGDSSWVRKIHVLTADMPVPSDEDQDPAMGDYRLGQIPDWLDKERVFGVTEDADLQTNLGRVATINAKRLVPSDPPLQWHFHSEVFSSPAEGLADTTTNRTNALQGDWSAQVLPTFNSFAIETRMSWLDDLADNRYALVKGDDRASADPLMIASRSMTTCTLVDPCRLQISIRPCTAVYFISTINSGCRFSRC